jgi:CheY-like chemotaxis protein
MNGAPHRILVIDDNEAIHEDFRKTLLPARGAATQHEMAAITAALFDDEPMPAATPTGAGFAIDSAHQGQQGVALVRQAEAAGAPYAIAFLDVRMPPGWDGIETASRLWEVAPELQIVLCTAYSDHPWEEIVARLGTRDGLLILKKPFDAIEVVQLAHALSAKWDAQRAVRAQMRRLEDRLSERTGLLQKLGKQLKQEISAKERVAEALRGSQLGPASRRLRDVGLSAQQIHESGELLQHSFDKLIRLLSSYRGIVQSLVSSTGNAPLLQSVRDAESQADLDQLRTGIPEELRRITDAAEHLLAATEQDSPR